MGDYIRQIMLAVDGEGCSKKKYGIS